MIVLLNLRDGLKAVLITWGVLCATAYGQPESAGVKGETERWNFHAQGTIIGQTHGFFTSPYRGVNSLKPTPEADASLTTTFFLGLRPWKGGEVYVNPEIAGGRGLSGVVGMAGFPNGDITRVTTATPKLYLSRIYLRQTWGLGGESELVEAGPNQLAGHQPVRRFSLILGKIALTDFFDNNSYNHDPRLQFVNWALMYQGAWDYPADTRGYTWGMVAELNQPRWTLRGGSTMVAKVANGLELDKHLWRNHGEVIELELRHKLSGRQNKVRLLGWVNHANMGNYREALRDRTGVPDITQSERAGTVKYGLGLNAEQALGRDMGAFMRLGWDDGKTETWMFTEIDRTLQLGLQFNGRAWRRPQDIGAAALANNGLSRDHRDYLATGGSGFILGDGRLNYSTEQILEAYYAFKLRKMFTLTLDYQWAKNPGYNRDRGPVSIWTARFHWEL